MDAAGLLKRIDARVAVAGLMMLAAMIGWSCGRVRGGRGEPPPAVVAVPEADRRLLRELALADPSTKPEIAAPLASPRAAPPPFRAPPLTSDDGRRAEDCLTAAVYYEARSEPMDGQRAVAQVVLNRVRDRAFPASVCGVVYQRSARVCQFTFACDGSMTRPIDPHAWARARFVAAYALAGGVFAAVGAATHYHTSAILPWWAPSLARIGAIGSHVFYRWRDGLAGALSFRQAYAGHEAAIGPPPATGVAQAGGIAVEQGVAVHRGPAAAVADAAVADTAPAVTATASSHVIPAAFVAAPRHGQTRSFGVTVYRGGASAAPAPAEPAQ